MRGVGFEGLREPLFLEDVVSCFRSINFDLLASCRGGRMNGYVVLMFDQDIELEFVVYDVRLKIPTLAVGYGEG